MVDYWAQSVAGGAVQNEFVDGIFTDDPAGYGQEHPSIRQRNTTNTRGLVASCFPFYLTGGLLWVRVGGAADAGGDHRAASRHPARMEQGPAPARTPQPPWMPGLTVCLLALA